MAGGRRGTRSSSSPFVLSLGWDSVVESKWEENCLSFFRERGPPQGLPSCGGGIYNLQNPHKKENSASEGVGLGLLLKETIKLFALFTNNLY